MTQLEIMTITGITGMLTGFSGAYPEELRNKCGQLNIDSNELYSIVTNPLYMQNGILTQAGEDRVRNFAGELKETIDSRRNALEADKEKHRLELSMLDHASFVLENLIAGNTCIYDMEQLPAADKAYYQLSNRLVTAENAEQLEQVEAMQDEYPLYKVGEISLASLKNHKQSQEALDLLKDALMREAGMENADGQVPDAGIHADGNNMIIEEEKEKGPAPESSEEAKTRFMELKEEEKRIDLEAVRAYQNIYYLTKGNKLDPMFMNAEELHGKDGFGGGTRGILNVVNSLDEKLFPEDVPAELEENRDKVNPDHFHLSSRTWTYEKEQEKKRRRRKLRRRKKAPRM